MTRSPFPVKTVAVAKPLPDQVQFRYPIQERVHVICLDQIASLTLAPNACK